MAEENKPKQMSSDSFASLASLMRSKKAWATAPKPLAPASLSESALSTPTATREHATILTASEDIAVPNRDLHSVDNGKIDLNAPPTAEAQGYDEAVMNKMEEMIAEMRSTDTKAPYECEAVPSQPANPQLAERRSYNLSEAGTADAGPTHGRNVQALPSAPTFGFRTADYERVSRSKDDEPTGNQCIVRCTPQVWDTMITQMTTLKKEKMEALAKLATLQRDGFRLTQAKGDNSSELDELRYRLQVNKDHKAIMSRDLRQKDVELLNKDHELNTLKKQVVDLPTMREQNEKLQAEIEYLRTKAAEAAENSGADAGQFTQIILFKDQEIAQLKEWLVQSKTKLSDHQKRAENLVDTQTAREKKLKYHERQLRAADDTEERLHDGFELLKTNTQPLEMQVRDLESQLRDKVSSCDRMRNDLKHAEKRLEVASKALHKIDNHLQLKGAAHLIIPSDQTKLPRLVLPCLECFAKNITCDAHSRCRNCAMSEEKCRRWRCSQVHILRDGCEDYPCLLTHDANGWLMLKQEQPQW